MRDEPHAERSSGARRHLLWVQRALVGAGAAMLLWVAASLTDTYAVQRMARASMPAAPSATVALERSASTRPVVLSRGAPIGELSIPRLQLSAMVLHGSDTRTLRRGPGHIEDTPLPGESGNVAIAGHRDSFFRPLRDVRLGDDIFIQTFEGRFQYRVSSFRVVDATDVGVIGPTSESTLTLVTCFPFWVVGPAPDRFVVRAVEVKRQVIAPALTDARPIVADRTPVEARTVASPPVVSPVATRAARVTPTAVDLTRRQRPGDDVLVRQAVERFRVTYNTRSAKRQDGAPVAFDDCAVALSDDAATAICRKDGPETGVWIFALRASGDSRWDITSVESR